MAVSAQKTRGHGERRTRTEGQFLAALLSSPTMAEAARRAGVSERSAARWMSDPEFKERLKAAQDEIVGHSLSRLKISISESLDVLRGIMNDGGEPTGARVTAARVVLDNAIKAIETVDIIQRIEALEAAQDGKEK